MTYKIKFAKSATKELSKLPKQIQVRILKKINVLASDPRSGSVRRMVGTSAWRLRVGDYRVIYDINDREITVLVLRIAHRREVYKKVI